MKNKRERKKAEHAAETAVSKTADRERKQVPVAVLDADKKQDADPLERSFQKEEIGGKGQKQGKKNRFRLHGISISRVTCRKGRVQGER